MEYQLKKLVTHYRKALQIKPDNLAVYHQIAELYYEQGNLDKTLEVCQEALQIQPDSALVLIVLNKMLQTLGFEGEEVTAFQNIPKNKLYYESLHILLSRSQKVKTFADAKTWKDAMVLGYHLKLKKHWDEAIAAYMKAIEIEPSLSLSYFELNYIICYCTSLEPKQIESIITSYHQVIKARITPPCAYVILGDMLTKQDKIAEAITAYKTAINQTTYSDNKYTNKYIDSHKINEVSFLIIGIGKCGTSSLYIYLCQHPQILSSTKKEVRFFNQNFDLGLDWYLAHFPPLPVEGGFLTGEATPWYLSSYGVEKKVFELFPNIKLIAILRNPVTRAISHYYMHLRSMRENRSLEVAMTSELEILKGMADPTQVSEKYWQTEKGYLQSGLYFYFLEKWMTVFPREQFLILRSEDLSSQTDKTMKQVYEFLEIPNYSLSGYPKINSGYYSDISNELRQKLSDFFLPHNQKLEDYLSRKFNWE
ncbi:tetratricopeptide repeat protein [Tolypothrix sp. PCC 7910]|uniref:sulfotransferase domain-containing protein n=1 Tax=Tolypothrix sp. PCC 7910 TaxID=2099387 RepID=UPI00142793F7|nr:sulfotransferase domain-containing protein [Tolypothrix sp. PCC 7910]QIR37170.1 tetratricopeptide repeat protein [Tolypothrix sp. PCC 7910]